MVLLRDRSCDFETAGVTPLGISRDSPWTQLAWAQALDLGFGLLSDWNGDATRGFGVGEEARGLRDVPARAAFLIGPDRRVRQAWHYEPGQLPDFDALLAAARAS
jgi:peroxiredoxin